MAKILRVERSFRSVYQITDSESEPIEKERYKSSYREFDENGNVLEDITYLPDGNEDRRYLNEYLNGMLVDEKLFYDGDALSEHNTFEYDDGRLKRSWVHYEDGSQDVIVYAYDEHGQMIQKILYDEDNEIEEKHEWLYDQNMLMSTRSFEGGDMDAPVKEENYMYTDNGQLAEKVIFDHADELKIRQVFEYDGNGKEILVKRYQNDELKEKIQFERDAVGRAVKIIEEQPGDRMTIYQEFDEHGNVVLQKALNIDGKEIYTIRRTYDDEGNMVESTVMEDRHGIGVPSMEKITVELDYEE
ncbi:MAG: hypothetical protein R6T91_08745 [Bacteroidales bacterium]